MSSVHIPYQAEDSKWFEYEQQWKVATLNLLNRHIPSAERGSMKVLDFGCGRGELLNLLSQHHYTPEGADFDGNCVDLSSKFAPTKLLADTDLSKHFSEKRFDIVCALHVLEHLRNPTEVVEKFKKISRNYLLLVVPNLQSTAYLSLRSSYRANEGHVYGWDYAHFENFLSNICQLDVIEMTGDTVPFTTKISRVDRILHKVAGRSVIRKLEEGFMLKNFKFLSNSILALCKVK
jgi:SAM-dependent methyltransferase